MVSYRRNFAPGGTYFFTVTLKNRSSNLLIEEVELLKNAFSTVKHQHPYQMKAFVILPDHLHCIWELPFSDYDYSSRWKKIKAHFSKGLNKKGIFFSKTARGEYNVWQRRFWEHTIEDLQDYENHLNYIHYNPMKHGLVTDLKEWPHSSYHHFVATRKLLENWGFGAMNLQNFDDPYDK